ncbi:MAG: quinol:cytochrome C oxidoreductase [Chitinophagaceae bacterium]|nr:quinol:cytochrome C oxidoreductase [Chitinophagaceae bacterium]
MLNQEFKVPASLTKTSWVLIALGVIGLIYGVSGMMGGDDLAKTQFWATIMHNSIFYLLISVASIFILTATSLAQGAWIVAFRRIPEAIAANVWVFAIIVGVLLLSFVWTNNTHIYSWLDPNFNPKDNPLNGLKNFFLSKGFFTFWTVAVLLLWSLFGIKMRQLSIRQDSEPKGSTKTYWKNFNVSAGFALVFALSLASTIPWLWIMSIDSHWFSTMFSWYNFASSFVSGMSMIMLWILFLKRKGYMGHVLEEHVHDVGKFMFAFSIFWTYLWFSQYMLIWYANIPEETVYFQIRQNGPYKFFYYLNFILNFVAPILILMPRPNKRNYFVVSLVAIIIIFGHWIDFFQMIMPGTVQEHWEKPLVMGLLITCGFAGLLMQLVSRTLTKAPLTPQNHPFLKETIIHIS